MLHRRLACYVAVIALASSSAALAKELPAGTVISAANFDAVASDTFQGGVIGKMIAPVYQQMIKTRRMTVRLAPPKPYEVDPRMIRLTAGNAKQVKLNGSGRVENFSGGIPFPNIAMGDPQAGRKLAYNIVYSGFIGDVLDWPSILFVQVDSRKGYLRRIAYKFALYQMIGRKNPPPVEGDGSIRSYTTLVATHPTDLRGVGTFSIRYADGRPDDIYAYLKSVRRFRRLSGGAWYSPVPGSDFLGDETSNGMNADPGWYKSFRLLGKTVMLFPESEQTNYYYPGGKGLAGQFPFIDMKNPPFWNTADPKEVWRPREVYVLEMTPPQGYPMSKKIYYVDTNRHIPIVYMFEGYDRAGKLWHLYTNSANRARAQDGSPTLNPIFARLVDMKKGTATLLPGGPGRRVNPKGVTAKDFSLESLRSIVE